MLRLIGLVVSIGLGRRRLSQREAPGTNPEGRSSMILGAAITAVELPTAFPYFAAIAAIVGSGIGSTRQIALLVLFDVCFVLPLIGIVGMLTVAGDRAALILSRARDRLRAHWPAVLAGVALLAGIFVVTIGVTGLAVTLRSGGSCAAASSCGTSAERRPGYVARSGRLCVQAADDVEYLL
jgi:cytochrome c biogenesis protein CcdA